MKLWFNSLPKETVREVEHCTTFSVGAMQPALEIAVTPVFPDRDLERFLICAAGGEKDDIEKGALMTAFSPRGRRPAC